MYVKTKKEKKERYWIPFILISLFYLKKINKNVCKN